MGQLTPQRRQALIAVALVTAIALPVLWAGLAALGRDWHPAGDWAVIELRTRDVGSMATPLIGPYSRYGWNHPGPLLFWILAVPYRLSGSSSSSLLLSAAVINVTAVGGIGYLAWRRGRLPLVWITSVAIGLLVVGIGPSQLRDPWNPSITILPLALFVFAVWSTFECDDIGVPVLVVIGSFLVQSHIGFAPLVAALSLLGLFRFVRFARWRRPVVLSAAIAIICWTPVLIDQLFGSGNLMDLFRYFATPGHEAAGIPTAMGILARELGGIAPWLGASEPVASTDGHLLTASTGRFVIPAFIFVGAMIAAHKRNASSAVRFQIVTATAALVALISISRITPPVYDYLVRWTWVVAMMLSISTAWSLWSVLTSASWLSSPAARRNTACVLGCVGAVIIAWSGAWTVLQVGRVGTPDGDWWVQIEAITPDTVTDTLANTPPGARVLVMSAGSENGSVADGVRLQLERAGIPVLVDDELIHTYGSTRLVSRHTPATTLVVVMGPMVEEMNEDPVMTQIAHWDPMTPTERAIQASDMEALDTQLRAVGRSDLADHIDTGQSLYEALGLTGVDQELLGRVENGRRRGDQVAVFRVNDRS